MSAPLMAAGAAGAIFPKGKAGEVIKIIIILLAVWLAYKLISGTFSGLSSILEAFGLKESEDERKTREELEGNVSNSTSPTSPWSPQFYKNAPSGAKLVTRDYATTQAYRIWDSVGSLYDDPEQGLAAIKTMPSQAAVSFLADIFNQNYHRDLIGWLTIKYDTDAQKKVLNQIFSYVSKLPKY